MSKRDTALAINHTISEIILIMLVILTCGAFLLIRKSGTEKSYIHRYFKPIDDIMYDPRLDEKLRKHKRRKKMISMRIASI